MTATSQTESGKTCAATGFEADARSTEQQGWMWPVGTPVEVYCYKAESWVVGEVASPAYPASGRLTIAFFLGNVWHRKHLTPDSCEWRQLPTQTPAEKRPSCRAGKDIPAHSSTTEEEEREQAEKPLGSAGLLDASTHASAADEQGRKGENEDEQMETEQYEQERQGKREENDEDQKMVEAQVLRENDAEIGASATQASTAAEEKVEAVTETEQSPANGSTGSPTCAASFSSVSDNAWCAHVADDLVPWASCGRWEDLLGGRPLVLSKANGGRVGLRNIGNTCFFNATLQCLSHVAPLAAYFLTQRYQEELRQGGGKGDRGKLAEAFARLQQTLWQGSQTSHAPRELHEVCAGVAPWLFEGMEQQDAQECLMILLDALNDDLNLSTANSAMSDLYKGDDDMMKALEKERGEEFVAAIAWMRHLCGQKSVLVDLLQGQIRCVTACLECGHTSKVFDPIMYMSLPVSKTAKSIEHAFSAYLAEEHLGGDDRWRCPLCERPVDSTRKIDIWKLPPVLVVHFKRFDFDRKTFRPVKISSMVQSPLRMDLSNLVATSHKEPLIYDLVGVVDHHGRSAGVGHYTATCLHPTDGQYWRFDDSCVFPAKDEDVITHNAYVLFYERAPAPERRLRRQTTSRPSAWPHVVCDSVIQPVLRELQRAGQGSSPADAS